MNDKAVATELTKIAGLIFRPTFLQHREPLQEGEQAKPWKLYEIAKNAYGKPFKPELVDEYETEREAQIEQRRQREKQVRTEPQVFRRYEYQVSYEKTGTMHAASELVKVARELVNKYASIAERIATDPLWQTGRAGESLSDKMSKLLRAAADANREFQFFDRVSSAMSVQLGSRSEVMAMTRQIEALKKAILDVQNRAYLAMSAAESLHDEFTRAAQEYNG
jgi:polyhydroxyalkanoate synthesis regulator phasin